MVFSQIFMTLIHSKQTKHIENKEKIKYKNENTHDTSRKQSTSYVISHSPVETVKLKGYIYIYIHGSRFICD